MGVERVDGAGGPSGAAPFETGQTPDPRYQAAFARGLDAVVFFGTDTHFVEVNDSARRMFGVTDVDITNHSVLDFMPESVDTAQVWQRLMERGSLTGEFPVVRLDGTVIEAELTAMRDVVPGIHMAVIRDVSNRRSAERALRESEARFRLLAENAPDIIYRYVMQPEMKMDYISPACERITGYSPEEFYATSGLSLKIAHPDDAEIVRRVTSDPESLPRRFEIRWICKDGRMRWTAQRLNPVYDDAGVLTAVEGMGTDITERKRNQAIDDLSHEIDRAVLEGQGLAEILSRICASVSELFGFPLVWVGIREPDGRVTPKAYSGDGAQILEGIEVRWDRGDEAQGPAGQAIATGETQVMAIAEGKFAPWRDRLASQKFVEVAAVPLVGDAEPLGCFVLDSRVAGVFSEEVLAQLENLAARVTVSLHVAEAQSRLRLQVAAMDAAANAMLITDAEGTIEWANSAYLEMSGYSLDETIGEPIRLMSSKTRKGGSPAMLRTVLSGKAWRGELVERRKDGALYTAIETVTPITDEETGEINHYVGVYEDVTALREAEGQLLYQTMYDPLTGLANRGLLLDRLTRALTRGEVEGGAAAAVFVVDIDDFKLINDSLGYEAGDLLLAEAADRLKRSVGPLDTVARIAGDEFGILVEDVEDEEACLATAASIADAFADSFELGHLPSVSISASVGIALGVAGSDPGVLVRDAEVALHRAKEKGRGSREIFNEGYRDRSSRRLEIMSDLYHAVSGKQLVIHYQPVINMASGAVTGAEALVRWIHPTKGMVQPLDFIPVAEETGVIVEIGQHVLERSLKQVTEWQQTGVVSEAFEVAVNLSAVQIEIPEFPSVVAMLLEKGGFAPGTLSLEITESILLRDIEGAIRFLNRVRAIGVSCSIDDFGTGYSSFGYLQNLPVGALKIDRMFIDKLDRDGGSSAIVRGIVEMAHALEIQTIGEGVETPEQLDLLRSLGCDYVQGFHIAKPLPPAEFAALMTSATTW